MSLITPNTSLNLESLPSTCADPDWWGQWIHPKFYHTSLNNTIRQASLASITGISAHSAVATAQTSDSNVRHHQKPSRKALENAAAESTLRRKQASEHQAKRRTAVPSAAYCKHLMAHLNAPASWKTALVPIQIKIKLMIYRSTSKAVNWEKDRSTRRGHSRDATLTV